MLIGPQRPTLAHAASSRCGRERDRSLLPPPLPLPWPVPAVNGSDVVKLPPSARDTRFHVFAKHLLGTPA